MERLTHHLSQATFDRLTAELEELTTHGRTDIARKIQAARELGENTLRRFAFRAVSPAIADEPLHLAMRKAEHGFELGSFASDGRRVVTATANI